MIDAARATDGSMVGGDPQVWFEGVTLDSRLVAGGELFFALPGEQADGHAFVGAAASSGAAGAVVERPKEVDAPPEFPLIEVESAYRALHSLTRSARRRMHGGVIAITGSAGKTTTKELLALMLAGKYRVASSPGNFNNLLGFPVSLLSAPDTTEWMVAEMGMSVPGELAEVSRLGQPNVAVFTNVRLVHLEAFDREGAPAGLREIAEAKSEILEGLDRAGQIVANAGDPEVVRIVRRHVAEFAEVRITWYAADRDKAHETPDLWVEGLRALDSEAGVGSAFQLVSPQGSTDVRLPIHGPVNVENCLAAAACASSLGVSLAEIAEAVHQMRAAPGRGAVIAAKGGFTVIDDSYNSNPEALSYALEAASRLPAERQVAVLGEMLELGTTGAELHRLAGRAVADAGFALLLGVGEGARQLVETAEKRGVVAEWFPDSSAAAQRAVECARSGDLWLIKGSRGVRLEAVVERLLEGDGVGGSA